ncbi:MAG TPA: ATP-binding protein [Thermoanaerobaculia bacterium]
MNALPEIFDMTESFFTNHALEAGVRYPVELALEEIFTNLVKYNASSSRPIEIALDLSNGEVTVTLTDNENEPFDITAMPELDVALPIEQRLPGGLGVHLVRKMMDRVEFKHLDGESTITLAKRLG